MTSTDFSTILLFGVPVQAVKDRPAKPQRRPTREGKRRFPPDGRLEGITCTCHRNCPEVCKGGCGCKACREANGD